MPKKALRSKARENVEATFRDSDGVTKKLSVGTHPSNLDKHSTSKHQSFGISVGVTLNMGDFQSLRADVWLSDEIQESETREEAFERINEILQEELKRVVESVQENL